jgi:hypothetical protein
VQSISDLNLRELRGLTGLAQKSHKAKTLL